MQKKTVLIVMILALGSSAMYGSVQDRIKKAQAKIESCKAAVKSGECTDAVNNCNACSNCGVGGCGVSGCGIE